MTIGWRIGNHMAWIVQVCF